ncbi:E3 ubiquitin-protein ligase JMJ24-like isoform X1 [Primulina huaijiensis]|uniref:E3 ubiquitin-protein ligase JMJ24-like isoform X1 n=1 Tax=Primulina huaijiensis TaxID=1492673 RepID=UPI003CC710F7
MMDHPQLSSGVGEDNIGIPDDLRCKRSDGKQWRCTAMSMPDKTVCEKHYIQAKKRAANSAIRASVKKTKRKFVGEGDVNVESKSDVMDLPLGAQFVDHSGSASGTKKKDKLLKGHVNYSPEIPSGRSFSARSSLRSTDDLDGSEYVESPRSCRTPPTSAVDSSKSRSQKTFEVSPTMGTSDGSFESSDDTRGQPCHQCRRSDREMIWCLKCDRRGYCDSCISTWYPGVPVEEIQRVCPACRGTCSCMVCLRGDNLIKTRIREIPAKEKLQYLYCLLSAVLPMVKKIHSEQCSEVQLEKRLRGNRIDLVRTKISADEQMCCNSCRMLIIDYHRHCIKCSYDLCLNCCKDIRKASDPSEKLEMNEITGESDDQVEVMISGHIKLSDVKLNLFRRYPDWKANADGSILCPKKEYGGCGSYLLTLKRIFKMNWVAKLVKNVEEMVDGCKVRNSDSLEKTGFDLRLCQAANREKDDNLLYHPSSQDIKNEGIGDFRMHWNKGKPVIIKEICDTSAMSSWDPMVIWEGIKKMNEEKTKDADRVVKAVDYFDWTEINIELGEFMKGYFDGRIRENGLPQLLKLKDWPSPSASEEFLLCHRSDFISKLPLLEFIHSKWGLLNVAAKLPHYSLQNDVGPRISITYGIREEIGQGDSIDNLHLNMRDMVFLLVHTSEVDLLGMPTKNETMQTSGGISADKKSCSNPDIHLKLSPGGEDGPVTSVHPTDTVERDGHESDRSFLDKETAVNYAENRAGENSSHKSQVGGLWDVFHRKDVPLLIEYIRSHWKELGRTDDIINDNVSRSLYDGVIYLNRYHRRQLKEEFGVEPWSFEHRIGEAIFIPAGCPFQARHIQSSVQLGLDFLSPESLPEAVRLSEEIRGLPNDHEAKLQILEVGKISLYAASSAIREVQKIVLDSKLGPELGFEDPNLTSLVSKHLESMVKQRQVTCS